MSSSTVERQHKGLGKALGNILLQSQHAQDCGRGESGGVRKLKADWQPLSPGLLATWQQLGCFSTDSYLQWRKSLEAASVGISARWGVWHTCSQIAFLKHWCKAGYRTWGSTAPAKPRLQSDGLCHHMAGWACCSPPLEAGVGSAAVSRSPERWNKVPSLPLAPRCPWHVELWPASFPKARRAASPNRRQEPRVCETA